MAPYAQVAVTFASDLVAGQFEKAHALLSPVLRERVSPRDLRESLYSMFRGYSQAEPKSIHFNEEFAGDEWPGRLPGDVGWAHVSIEGDDFVEAVTVTVMDLDDQLLIRHVEWGRP